MMKTLFLSLVLRHSNDELLAKKLWSEIEKAYSGKQRHYHNLSHLENLVKTLELVKPQIQDWDTILFAVFYHDAVYNTLRKDNEEKSAVLAKKRLQEIGYASEKIEACFQHIIATKTHIKTGSLDTDLLTDADLSILGAEPQNYQAYAQNTRKEYSIYPDFMYSAGRKKVLEHFSQMPQIFKTPYFFEKYEVLARTNLNEELKHLG